LNRDARDSSQDVNTQLLQQRLETLLQQVAALKEQIGTRV
jgi:hypothetical protein